MEQGGSTPRATYPEWNLLRDLERLTTDRPRPRPPSPHPADPPTEKEFSACVRMRVLPPIADRPRHVAVPRNSSAHNTIEAGAAAAAVTAAAKDGSARTRSESRRPQRRRRSGGRTNALSVQRMRRRRRRIKLIDRGSPTALLKVGFVQVRGRSQQLDRGVQRENAENTG